jgi:hypothetical protein
MLMDYVAVSSSTIAAIAYDGEGRTLGVQFTNGGEYWYHRVPRPVYEGFVGAESKGRYFGEFVRNAYACAKVR